LLSVLSDAWTSAPLLAGVAGAVAGATDVGAAADPTVGAAAAGAVVGTARGATVGAAGGAGAAQLAANNDRTASTTAGR